MEWVNVKDAMPELDVPVLIYVRDVEAPTSMHVCWLTEEGGFENEDGEHSMFAYAEKGVCTNVLTETFWMPLPEKPKGE